MQTRFRRRLPLLWGMVLAGGWAVPHPGGEIGPPASPPVAPAVRTEQAPTLDGEVLNDPTWQGVSAITGFWQITPEEGQPASEKTAVHVLYTERVLYFGVVCYDSNPGSIIVNDSRRDTPLDDTDSFQIILDTYLDKQNGFVFGTNPAGIEYDGQVVNEGQGTGLGRSSQGRATRQAAGSGGGFNLNWDGSWEVRTRISEVGWSAEFAIPLRTLRFPRHSPQNWGMNFQRNIRRRNETAFWAPLPRSWNLHRLSLAGQLTGLDLTTPRNLKLVPYVSGELRRRGEEAPTQWPGNIGGDIKYSVTPSLTLDATYNTDFAQVEVDELQINLDRFDLFFPEKRPFFLENAGLFSVGTPGEVELFFSRRIGIGPEGEVIPILGGARLSGKVSRFNLGLLNMQTEEAAGVSPAHNFTVARLSRELPNRSFVGALFVNRQATGDPALEQDHNRTFSVDGRWGIGEYGEIAGFAARTSTPGVSEDQHAYKIGTFYDSGPWLLRLDYTEVADNFDPQVGFLRREGFRKPSGSIFRRWRPENFMGLHELRPHVSYVGFWNFEGFQETGRVHLDNHWEWKSGAEVHTGMNITREGVTESFEIFPGIFVPSGTYDHTEAQLVAFTDQSAPVSLNVRWVFGGFFGGNRHELIPSLKFRLGETFNTELFLERNDVDLPLGSFVTNLARARLSYSFSPRTFLQGLVQYNDRAEIWSMNIRFGLLQAANTGLFIVYNDTRGLAGFDPLLAEGDLRLPDRSLTIKINRIFDLLN